MTENLNEQAAARAFSQQSLVFDGLDAGNSIVAYKRRRVRDHVLLHLPEGGSILELNAGTGEDAIFFARKGHRVHATDIAVGMQEALGTKVVREGLTDMITREICSFTGLASLRERGPYDLIFSNFAGLNCTGELDKVLRSFDTLLKPGGQVTLAILPKFSLWESLMLFKGKFRTATRRWFASKGARSHVEGHYFRCWYYSPGYVIRELGKEYELLELEGLCTMVPPSYIEHFAERYPGWYRRLCRMEDRWKGAWPWKYIGDYYIISFRKRDPVH
ncbi:MAG TPA: class I SAM-dependent methyltransferase [Puia sp.]|jgi:ubiquinone/menaquinone biosynthesis C-methylase UbiE